MEKPLTGEALQREFDRIGVDARMRTAMVFTGDIREGEVWAAFRQAPDGSGNAGVEAALHRIIAARRQVEAGSDPHGT
jgi:hypothetical protein